MDLSAYHRIVVKVGSALLVDQETCLIKASWMQSLCDDISTLMDEKKDVLVVSSGAIAVGRKILNKPKDTLSLQESQMAAMVGQPTLMDAWRSCMGSHNILTGQALLTKQDIEHGERRENARNALNTLINMRGIPVINENDTVATSEITYGDNDQLAAHVATMVDADMLILLSDIDGIYTANPQVDPTARHIPLIETISDDIEAMAGPALSKTSKGGMTTKVLAGKIATNAGCSMLIAKGHVAHPISAVRQGARCSHFVGKPRP